MTCLDLIEALVLAPNLRSIRPTGRRSLETLRPQGPTSQLIAPKMSSSFDFVERSGGIEWYVHKGNGLEVLVLEDHAAPVATFMVTYRVGSRNVCFADRC